MEIAKDLKTYCLHLATFFYFKTICTSSSKKKVIQIKLGQQSGNVCTHHCIQNISVNMCLLFQFSFNRNRIPVTHLFLGYFIAATFTVFFLLSTVDLKNKLYSRSCQSGIRQYLCQQPAEIFNNLIRTVHRQYKHTVAKACSYQPAQAQGLRSFKCLIGFHQENKQ